MSGCNVFWRANNPNNSTEQEESAKGESEVKPEAKPIDSSHRTN